MLQKTIAQVLPEILFSSSGGQLKGGNIQIDYAVGEVAIASFSNNLGNVHEGLLQWFAPVKPKFQENPKTDFADSTLKVYEFLTPNGDGKNDFFYVNGIQKYKENELFILNRWGETVYKTVHYDNTWDGADLSEGSYYYILKLTNENRVLTGGFSLLR